MHEAASSSPEDAVAQLVATPCLSHVMFSLHFLPLSALPKQSCLAPLCFCLHQLAHLAITGETSAMQWPVELKYRVTALPRGADVNSALCQAVLEIQRRLPKARILYVSATGATEPENLCFMTRLGLWGDGTPFLDKKAMVHMLKDRGVSTFQPALHQQTLDVIQSV